MHRVLEAPRGFRPDDYPDQDERSWMRQVGLLTADEKAFRPDVQANIGQAIYRTLFPPGSKVEGLLRRAMATAQGNNTQLHVQIRGDSVHAAGLFGYPWELLHNGQGTRFVGRGNRGVCRDVPLSPRTGDYQPVEKGDWLRANGPLPHRKASSARCLYPFSTSCYARHESCVKIDRCSHLLLWGLDDQSCRLLYECS